MKNRRGWIWAGAAMLAVGVAIGTVYAKIGIDANFKGTVMITSPEGKITMLDPGNAVPEIPSKSKIEVFKGQMTVRSEEGDEMSVGCIGKTGLVQGAAVVEVQSGESSGTIKVVKGSMTFTDEKGKPTVLKEGEQTECSGDNKKAPATGAGQEIGTAVQGPPPVDSRSLDSSPSK